MIKRLCNISFIFMLNLEIMYSQYMPSPKPSLKILTHTNTCVTIYSDAYNNYMSHWLRTLLCSYYEHIKISDHIKGCLWYLFRNLLTMGTLKASWGICYFSLWLNHELNHFFLFHKMGWLGSLGYCTRAFICHFQRSELHIIKDENLNILWHIHKKIGNILKNMLHCKTIWRTWCNLKVFLWQGVVLSIFILKWIWSLPYLPKNDFMTLMKSWF